ncbi:unnamed protein product [Polarella glacialis]|uniref:Uncharacterized protein n=1 Tax=Polarella glacialis TaxID=89957 RepID=A0A813LB18_POLGL|nr:unnamed protein product [Polarella glacialis]
MNSHAAQLLVSTWLSHAAPYQVCATRCCFLEQVFLDLALLWAGSDVGGSPGLRLVISFCTHYSSRCFVLLLLLVLVLLLVLLVLLPSPWQDSIRSFVSVKASDSRELLGVELVRSRYEIAEVPTAAEESKMAVVSYFQ